MYVIVQSQAAFTCAPNAVASMTKTWLNSNVFSRASAVIRCYGMLGMPVSTGAARLACQTKERTSLHWYYELRSLQYVPTQTTFLVVLVAGN